MAQSKGKQSPCPDNTVLNFCGGVVLKVHEFIPRRASILSRMLRWPGLPTVAIPCYRIPKKDSPLRNRASGGVETIHSTNGIFRCPTPGSDPVTWKLNPSSVSSQSPGTASDLAQPFTRCWLARKRLRPNSHASEERDAVDSRVKRVVERMDWWANGATENTLRDTSRIRPS